MSYVAAAGLVIAGGTAIYKTEKASKDQDKQRAALAKAKREQPEYFIDPAFEENAKISGNLAGQGLTSSAKDFYTSLVQGNLASSVGAAERSGAGVNSLAELLDTANQSSERLATQDSMLKTQNIGGFINENSVLAGERLKKKFGVPNIRSNNNIAGINNAIYQDQQGINAGLSDLTGVAASWVASQAYKQPSYRPAPSQAAPNTSVYAPTGQQGAIPASGTLPPPPLQPPSSLGDLQPTQFNLNYQPPQSQVPPFLDYQNPGNKYNY